MTARRVAALMVGVAALGGGGLAAGAGSSGATVPTQGGPARLLVYAQEWSLWPRAPRCAPAG
jgi:hypothetical protein